MKRLKQVLGSFAFIVFLPGWFNTALKEKTPEDKAPGHIQTHGDIRPMAAYRPDRYGEHNTAYLKNRKKILATCSVCGICGQPVDKSIKYPDPMSAAIDHIVPVSKGGHPSDISNLQLAHRWCNRQKSDKLIDIKERFMSDSDSFEGNGIFLHYDWEHYKAN